MNWTQLIDRVAIRANLPKSTVRAVLDATTEELTVQLLAGESVILHRIGTLSRRWSSGRSLRSIASGRKMWVGGRHTVRFSVSTTLKRAMDQSVDQSWRKPEHQAAWRLAETLVSDLELYNQGKVPRNIQATMSDEQVRSVCAAALGEDWSRAWQTWREKVSPEVIHAAHLAGAARRRWAQ